MYFGFVIKAVLLTYQCPGFHSIMLSFSPLCPLQQVGQRCDMRLERDTVGTVDPNGPKGHFLSYAIMLCNKSSEKGGGGGF